MEYILYYIAAVSVLSVMICCTDKIAAKSGARRISEKTLFIISLLGGAIAMYVTMRIIRHKTRHTKFMLGLPIIILLQIAIFLMIFIKFYKF